MELLLHIKSKPPIVLLKSNCPVPANQIPLNEYIELSNSWFFSIANKEEVYKQKILPISWITIWPLIFSILISGHSEVSNILKLIGYTCCFSLILPVLVLIRQWLGWRYIFKRLSSEIIEYEETGWYDGQTWEKPLEWRQKDLLIAQNDVNPLLSNLRYTLLLTITIDFFLIILLNLIP